jgi:hypothetical protein
MHLMLLLPQAVQDGEADAAAAGENTSQNLTEKRQLKREIALKSEMLVFPVRELKQIDDTELEKDFDQSVSVEMTAQANSKVKTSKKNKTEGCGKGEISQSVRQQKKG